MFFYLLHSYIVRIRVMLISTHTLNQLINLVVLDIFLIVALIITVVIEDIDELGHNSNFGSIDVFNFVL